MGFGEERCFFQEAPLLPKVLPLPKNKEFTDKIICNDDEDRGEDFNEVGIAGEEVIEEEDRKLLHEQGQDSSAREGDQLGEDRALLLLLTAKDEQAIGNKGKEHGNDPRDDIGDMNVDREEIEQKGDAPIDEGRHTAKKDIQNDLSIFLEYAF